MQQGPGVYGDSPSSAHPYLLHTKFILKVCDERGLVLVSDRSVSALLSSNLCPSDPPVPVVCDSIHTQGGTKAVSGRTSC